MHRHMSGIPLFQRAPSPRHSKDHSNAIIGILTPSPTANPKALVLIFTLLDPPAVVALAEVGRAVTLIEDIGHWL